VPGCQSAQLTFSAGRNGPTIRAVDFCLLLNEGILFGLGRVTSLYPGAAFYVAIPSISWLIDQDEDARLSFADLKRSLS